MSAAKICPQCGTEYPAEVRFCSRDGATLRSQDGGADLVGSVVAERYHVLKKLGEGGMGRVYLAEHVRMGRKSAVKVMHPAMVHDADAIGRFNREAANASQISHPNVAAVYDFGEHDGLIYLAMEFVDGEPLTALLAREGPLPPARTAAIIAQTADALSAAHDLGIVHRDLKPDNIMICRGRDGRDVVKVVDFGIAKAAAGEKQHVTKTGLVVGTLEYMSPEQLTGGELDGRSDLYSLAIVAFTMLTRALPFPADTPQESMILRLTDRPKRLDEVRPDIAWSPALQAVFDRALAGDPNQRHATVVDFARELAAAAGMTPPAGVLAQATAPVPGMALPTAPAGGSGTTAPTAPLPPTKPEGRVGGAAPPVATTRPSAAVVPPAAATTTPARRSPVPLLIAAVVLFVMVAGGGAYLLYRRTTAAPTQVAQADSSAVVPSGGPAAGTEPYGATTAAGAGSAASESAAARPADAEALANLARYERLIEESTMSRPDAREASVAIRKLLPQLGTRDDSTRALKVLALVLQSAGETQEMCGVLATLVQEPSLSESSRAVYEGLRGEQCASGARRPARPAPSGY